MSLEQQITSSFHTLSPQLQRAARYMLDHQHDVATQSQRHIAKHSGLTPTTLSRLSRAIGYDHYEHLRDTCRESLKAHTTPLADRAAQMQNTGVRKNDDVSTFAFQHAQSSIQNIEQMMASLDAKTLALMVKELSAADNVLLAGALSSRAMLDYLAHMASMALPNWRVVGNNGTAAAQALTDINRHSVVFTISIAPYLRSTVDFAESASQRRAKVLAITDAVASPILKFSHHSILVPTESQQFFPSHIALLTLVESVMGMVVRQSGRTAQKRVETVEKISHAIGDYY